MATTRCAKHFLTCDFFITLHTCKQRQTVQHSSAVHGVQMPLSSEAWECTLSSLGSAAEIMVCFVGRAPASRVAASPPSHKPHGKWEKSLAKLHWKCVQTKHFAQWSKTKCMIVPELQVRDADALSREKRWAGGWQTSTDQAGCLQQEIPQLFVLASQATLHHATAWPGRFLWGGSQQIFKKCFCHPKWSAEMWKG